MSLLEVTDETFSDIVNKADVPVVVDFWADWCNPCRKVSPILEQLAQEWGKEALVVKVNVDDCPQTASDQKVMGLPTISVFKNGQKVIELELTGATSKSNIKTVVESQF